MSLRYRTIAAVRHGLDLCYTWMVRDAFASWGAGSRIRRGAVLVCPHLIEVGRNVHIGEYAWLNAKQDAIGGASLRIGDGTYIGRFAQINAWRSVTIDNDVLIADRVYISDADHRFTDPSRPVKLQGDEFRGGVHLESGCWIGIGAVILPGVTVGRNAVVAANAVVTANVPARTVAAGIPARVLKTLQ